MKVSKMIGLGLLVTSFFTLTACDNSKEAKGNAKDSNEFKIVNVRFPESSDVYLTKGSVADSIKKTGIDVKWETYTTLDWTDKKAVVLGGGDLPDAFFGNSALSDSDVANNLASFISLEDYITPEIMPNLSNIMESDPTMKAIVTNPDGHIYTLPSRMPGRATVGNQLFINKKWLDNLGLEMPETIDEFEETMLAFATEDADGDGDKTNEVPFTGLGYRMLLPWGIDISSSPISWMNYDGDKVYYMATTDLYKETIERMHDLYEKGGIDQEFFTQDWTTLMNKVTSKDKAIVGVFDSYHQPDGAVRSEYVPLAAIEGLDGKKRVMRDQDPYARNQLVVTKECKDPEKLLKWIDEFYTEDNTIQTYFGPFGLSTEKNDDGTYSLLKPTAGENGEILSQDNFSLTNSLRDWAPQYGSKDLDTRINTLPDDGDGLKLKIAKPFEEFVGPQYPMLSYTVEEQKELSNLTADIDSFVSTKQAEWVTKGGVDKEWDSYIEQLEQMGLDKFLEIQNDALKRYNDVME